MKKEPTDYDTLAKFYDWRAKALQKEPVSAKEQGGITINVVNFNESEADHTIQLPASGVPKTSVSSVRQGS